MRLKTDYPTTSKDSVNLQYIMNSVYPVGAIYISTIGTNPATLFGFGTWTAFGAGKALVGLDSGDTDFDTVEETRGAKTHTLTGAESGLPAHEHTVPVTPTGSAVTGTTTYPLLGGGSPSGTSGGTAANASSAHNNIQPSIVVYMFKRSA